MKRVIALILSIAMVLSTATLITAAEEVKKSGYCAGGQETNVQWSLDDNGTLTISGNGEMQDFSDGSGSGSIPEWEKASITNIVIAEGVTKVGA